MIFHIEAFQTTVRLDTEAYNQGTRSIDVGLDKYGQGIVMVSKQVSGENTSITFLCGELLILTSE